MSFFTGIVDFDRPELDENAVRALVPERCDPDEVTLARLPGFALAKVDFGAFGEAGLVTDGARVTAVAGHPLFDPDRLGRSEGGRRGLDRVHEVEPAALGRLPTAAHGVFALARFDVPEATLILVADRLSVRPVYWWREGARLVFSTRLESVVGHPWVTPEVDEQGLLELLTLGYSLGRRTPFLGVERIGPAGICRFDRQGSRPSTWIGDGDEAGPATPEKLLRALRDAVGRRVRPGRQVAYLSGGLDSRVVCHLVAEAGHPLHSFNFSPEGSQDRVYARRYAEAVGLEHVEGDRGRGRVDWSGLMARGRAAVPELAELGPAPAWSGDGGSVCLGWVYVTDEIVRAMRAGDPAGAAAAHLSGHGRHMPARDLTAAASSAFQGRVQAAIVSLLETYDDGDPAKRFFRFLVDNDQRRHLDAHFESILDHRTEFLLPFYDGAVLSLALGETVDGGMGHGAYMRWFDLLGAGAASTPWQTYPGHLPCPLEEEGMSYQWAADRARAFDRSVAWEVGRLLGGGGLPARIVRRPVVLLRLLLHGLGLRDSSAELNWLRNLGTHFRLAASTVSRRDARTGGSQTAVP